MNLRFLARIGPALAVLVLAIHPADAATGKSKRLKAKERPEARIYDDRDRNSWYPRDADRLKFGSRIWFDQMEAEGRFGPSRRGER